MPTLRQLTYLVMIAEEGSFVRAARQARVSQPTMSQQIMVLEKRLGVRLIERGARASSRWAESRGIPFSVAV